MIKKFRHKGLKQLFDSGIAHGVNPQHIKRLRQILALLDTAETIKDMDLSGLKLHELKGKRNLGCKRKWKLASHIQNSKRGCF